MSGSNDDKAKAIAKKIINEYNASINNIIKDNPRPDRAKRYFADTRNHAAQELAKLAKSDKGISAAMRAKIERVASRIKSHDSGKAHGAWWASSGNNDNPSSWI